MKHRRLSISAWAATALLIPATLFAQATAGSFAELQPLVKIGDTVVVTDVSGDITKGRVIDLSASTLVVRTRETKSFSESRVATIGRTDSSWNGALIGAGVGGALALWGVRSTRGTSDSFYGWAYVGSWLVPTVGALVGWAADRSSGAAPVFERRTSSQVLISPMLTPRGAGVAVSLRY